jgi:hypothetical protein
MGEKPRPYCMECATPIIEAETKAEAAKKKLEAPKSE